MNIPIIYEDSEILVVNKPENIETTKSTNDKETIEDIIGNISLQRSGIVHRLDKDTTGVLIIAKTSNSQINLKKQFKNHTIKKTYIALVYGDTPDKGSINSFITRDGKRKQAMKAVSFLSGLERGKPRKAISHYRKIASYKYCNEMLSLLEVEIETGRTHQIRVHMQSIGTPIIGDKMYNTKLSKRISTELGARRQMLHSKILQIEHPLTNKTIKFRADVPDDLKNIINKLDR